MSTAFCCGICLISFVLVIPLAAENYDTGTDLSTILWEVNQLEDIASLEQHLSEVAQSNHTTDQLLLQAGKQFITQYPLHPDAPEVWEHYLNLAQWLRTYCDGERNYSPSLPFLAEVLFSVCSDSIQHYLQTETWSFDEEPTRKYLGILDEHQYFINRTPSLYKKLLFYIKRGDWEYIYWKARTTYRQEIFSLLAIFLLVYFIGIAVYRFKSRS